MNNKSDKDITDIKTLIWEVVENMQNSYEYLSENDESNKVIPSGFNALDERTGGFKSSYLTIIAGTHGIGKTAFALNIAGNVSINNKIPVAFFSFKISKKQVIYSLLSIFSEVSMKKLKTCLIAKEDWLKLSCSAEVLVTGKLFIIDTPVMTISEIAKKAKTLKAEQSIQMLIIDYLQLIKGFEKYDSSEILKSLKKLAVELKIHIIVLSQLDIFVEMRVNKRPLISDLRISGVIEQYADTILFIYRDKIYNKKKKEDDDIANVIIAKNRNQPIGFLKFLFNEETMIFKNFNGQKKDYINDYENIFDDTIENDLY